MRKRAPKHPGGILLRQYIEPLEINISDLARVLSASRKTISKIVNERGAITADMALRLSKAFNTTPELWLNLQINTTFGMQHKSLVIGKILNLLRRS